MKLQPYFCWVLLTACTLATPNILNSIAGQEVSSAKIDSIDSDNDGLSDFHERYKYLTNPNQSDSDGDGIADGDWKERREFQYTIRSIVQVMRPVTVEYLNDDFQDVRVLDETEEYVELEVIHYPFNEVASAISADPNWRKTDPKLKRWLAPGPSSNWNKRMQQELLAQLKKDGIDVQHLDDRQTVQQVSQWLMNRVNPADGFTTFITAWNDEGQPFIPTGLDGAVKRELSKSGRTIEDQFNHEVLAAGMFKNKTCGSCTSSAIYLNGCLRAIGIPTRTIYCIPFIDASDSSEFELLQGIKQPIVRRQLMSSASKLKNSWASHTFNEVYVGGHWHRLNYSNLGQGIYDKNLFGLITHVATFSDWADANAHLTIGRRQKTSNAQNDIFGHNNPYSTIALRDEMGPHCKVKMPEAVVQKIVISDVYWTDDEQLPKAIRDNCQRRDRFGCIAILDGVQGMDEFLEFMSRTNLEVNLVPEKSDQVTIEGTFDPGCFWLKSNGKAFIYVPISESQRKNVVLNSIYSFKAKDPSSTGWGQSNKLVLTRKKQMPMER